MTTAPSSAGTLFLVANLAGATADGVSGAEFRIFVTSGGGYFFSPYEPPPLQASDNGLPPTIVGTPLDLDASPSNPSGLNIAFVGCHTPTSGRLAFGSMPYFNAGGAPADLILTRHTPPSNLDLGDCPLFTLCDAPAYTAVCMTIQTPTLPTGEEPVAFRATLNKTCPQPAPNACGFVAVTPTLWSTMKEMYR
jgi:hypothetical protein